MSSINTNLSSLIAQNTFSNANQALNTSLERLSTGYQINTASDNPAGYIASQLLQSQQASLTAAINGAQQTNEVIGNASGGLQQTQALLTQLQGLVSQSANTSGLTSSQLQANQLQVDSILQSIDRIASTTTFAGTQLLNGSLDFTVSGLNAGVTSYQVNSVTKAPTTNVAVSTLITASARHGALYVSAGGTNLDLTSAGATFSFELAGDQGTKVFSFGSGTTLASIATSVNTFKSVTGVSAVASGHYLNLKSTDLGSSAFVSFRVVNAGGQVGTVQFASSTSEAKESTVGAVSFANATTGVRKAGVDVGAFVNGIKAQTNGNQISVANNNLNVNFTLSTTASQTIGTTTSFTITGGGATFNLGTAANLNNQVRIGIGNVSTSHLGSAADGYISQLGSGQSYNLINGNVQTAQKIVNDAITQVANLSARLGSFQTNVVGSAINSLNVAYENTSAAESAVTDTNFAAETANLTRHQVLVSASTSALSIANTQPENILKLLQNIA